MAEPGSDIQNQSHTPVASSEHCNIVQVINSADWIEESTAWKGKTKIVKKIDPKGQKE